MDDNDKFNLSDEYKLEDEVHEEISPHSVSNQDRSIQSEEHRRMGSIRELDNEDDKFTTDSVQVSKNITNELPAYRYDHREEQDSENDDQDNNVHSSGKMHINALNNELDHYDDNIIHEEGDEHEELFQPNQNQIYRKNSAKAYVKNKPIDNKNSQIESALLNSNIEIESFSNTQIKKPFQKNPDSLSPNEYPSNIEHKGKLIFN